MHYHISSRLRFLTLSATTVFALSGSFVTPAYAQNSGSGGSILEEVTVTGSRIQRRDYVSNSPIVTVDAASFEQQSGLNVESYLNQLPEYNPATSPVTTNQDVQITPTNSVGIASISLRGFGPNRSLVLVDGKRPVPVNALMVIDINGIPSSLLQRVETITGGASAVYGADAVGGVTNMLLRKNYEGFEFDGQYSMPEAGSGNESRISMLIGANFADGRGNVTFSAERYQRDAAWAVDRSAYTDRWSDPNAPGYFFFVQGNNAYSCDPNCPTWGTAKALMGGGANPSFWVGDFTLDSGEMPTFVDVQFNPDAQTVWTGGFPFQTALGQSRSQLVKDGLQYASRNALDSGDATSQTVIDGIKWNNLLQYASAPQDRYSFFGSAHFDFSDKLSVYARARYAQSQTRTLLFGTNAISGWETSIPYDPTVDSPVDPTIDYTSAATQAAIAADPAAFIAANPNAGFIAHGATGAHFPVPAELAILLNSRQVHTYCLQGTFGCNLPSLGSFVVPTTDAALVGTAVPNTGPTGRWQPQWNPDTSLPPRSTYNTISTWQIEAGVNFEIPWRDWNGEVYASHGQSNTYNVASGNLDLLRYRVLSNMPDYGAGGRGTGNTYYAVGTSSADAEVVDAIRPAFGVGDFVCTSGFYDTYFSGDQPLSKDCFDAINAPLQTRTEITQDIVEVNLQGGVYDLPAGEIRAAVGYQHREVRGVFNPDILQSEHNFVDQVVGVYPTGYLDATTHVNDYYIEALIPVVKDLPYVQKLELETGARYSLYQETDDQEWTYKILANWEVRDWLRFRGGYNRATRAPNLGELFLNLQEVFGAGGNFGNPCGVRSNSPFGAGGTTLAVDPFISFLEPGPPTLAAGQTQAGADSTEMICEAMMGVNGANYYYRGGNDVTADNGGGFAWVLQKGNPALQPETADTWTAGFVLQSPLDNPWLSNITLSFDWYLVEIKNAIMTHSVDYSNFLCFGTNIVSTPAEAAIQAATPECRALPRDQRNGAALDAVLPYDNLGTINTSGFDASFNWSATIADLGFNVPGNLAFSLQATILDYYETKQSPLDIDPVIDWTGSLGPTLPGTNGGAYDYRLFGNLSYSKDNWTVSLRWRHLPPVWSAGYAAQQAIIENNVAVDAGGPGIPLSYTPTTEVQTDSYDIFDLSGTWDYNDHISLRAGITNLLDTDPVNVATSLGYGPDADLTAPCTGAPTGCNNPTTRSLMSLGGFNGGYYDTLGRRFFLGLKVRF